MTVANGILQMVTDRMKRELNPEFGKPDDLSFILYRKKLWLAPTLLILLIFGALIVLSQGSVVAPFIYTIF